MAAGKEAVHLPCAVSKIKLGKGKGEKKANSIDCYGRIVTMLFTAGSLHMCQPFLYVLYQVLKQKATFIKCMCRKMYRGYIFVRIVTDPYFCHSQDRLLCIKMPHCVYLKNDVSGEAWLFILSCYLWQHSSVDFYSEKLNLCFLYYIPFALPFLYLELVLLVAVP